MGPLRGCHSVWKAARTRGHTIIFMKNDNLHARPVPAILAGMNLGNALRVVTVTAACFAAVGSATSNQETQQHTAPSYGAWSPPPAPKKEAGRALRRGGAASVGTQIQGPK